RQRPRATRTSDSDRCLSAKRHLRPHRKWSGVSRWQTLVVPSGPGVDGARVAGWRWRLSGNHLPRQRNAANDRLFPNIERSAHGSDAVLTILHLAIHRTGKSVHREPQLAAIVPEPDNGRG